MSMDSKPLISSVVMLLSAVLLLACSESAGPGSLDDGLPDSVAQADASRADSASDAAPPDAALPDAALPDSRGPDSAPATPDACVSSKAPATPPTKGSACVACNYPTQMPCRMYYDKGGKKTQCCCVGTQWDCAAMP